MLPQHQFRERHEIPITASSQKVMEILNKIDPFDDRITRAMMTFRKLPAQLSSRIQRKPLAPFDFQNFQQLTCNHKEIVFGLIGKFWQWDFGIISLETPADYLAYSEPQTAKLAINFYIQEITDRTVILSTETRVFCPDKISYRKFAPYWYLIRLGSGLIRRRTLSNIKNLAE